MNNQLKIFTGRDGDNHGGDTEEGVNVRACAHREEVVQPNDKRQYGNTDGRPNQRGIAEQTFTREGRCDFGEYPEDRQNQNVHFRMAPGPNQVDVHHHVAAHIVGKEMGAQIAIQGQQRDGNRQNRERGDDQYVGAQRGPGKDRHLEHCHTRARIFRIVTKKLIPVNVVPIPESCNAHIQ